jgi:UDP-N-acetylmuramoylalanine--D-glutamate ligase
MRISFYETKITVVGLARSGVGAANLLAFLGAKVTVTDMRNHQQLDEFIKALNPAVSVVLGVHPAELFISSDLIVVSPGVPMDILPLKAALEHGIRIIGELELAYEVLRSSVKESCPGVLAVTGTNGKSTTTALLNEMLRCGNVSTLMGGNIGNSIAAEILNLLQNPLSAQGLQYIVAELSSFQLDTIDTFRPKGATILNVTADHLDRYHEMDAYINSKCRITLNQRPSDFVVLNADDPLTPDVLKKINAGRDLNQMPSVFYFSRKKKVEGIYLDNGLVRFKLSADSLSRLDEGLASSDNSFVLDPESFIIRGVHNIENAMAAALMAYLSGCSIAGIKKALAAFPGLEHRLEFVRELGGVTYINDSKGTNVGAVLKSLEGFKEPLILIAGGKDKDSDFTLLRPLLHEKVRKVILVGAAAEKIGKAISDVVDCEMAGYDFGLAIAKARADAMPGDVVLLSPACASFDMFTDFEDRGRQFKRLVMEL